ncbi:PDZ domain-containing protein [bacterium]|nr:PDZ domain-containing protein [bacterium]
MLPRPLIMLLLRSVAATTVVIATCHPIAAGDACGDEQRGENSQNDATIQDTSRKSDRGSKEEADDSAAIDTRVRKKAAEKPAPRKYTLTEIKSFVRQLGDDEFAVRRQATTNLQNVGAPAIDAIKTAIEEGDLEIRLRAFAFLENIFTSDDLQTVTKTWEAIEKLSQNKDNVISERSRLLLLRNDDIRTALLKVKITEFNGIFDDTPTSGKSLYLDAQWSGGDEGLKYVRLLCRSVLKPIRSIYLINGVKMSDAAAAELEVTASEAGMMFAWRGAASLGIASSNFQVGLEGGCLVSDVQPGKAAANAGIRARDIITTFGGKPVENFDALVKLIEDYRPGQKVSVEISRYGQPLKVVVEMSRWRPPNRAGKNAPPPTKLQRDPNPFEAWPKEPRARPVPLPSQSLVPPKAPKKRP